MLHGYLPIIVFGALGIIVGGVFVLLNGLLGPRKPGAVKSEPYECGLPSEISKSFRFGITFYLVAMLFLLFDIEVVFLYPIAAVLKSADSIEALVKVGIFVVLLMSALVAAWRKGALDWR